MQQDLTLAAYDYDLPETHIAHYPVDRRDDSRLLVLDRTTGLRRHLHFRDIIRFFKPGDLLVVNDTKVFPARLFGNKESGGKAELFLLSYPAPVPGDTTNGAQHFDCEALIRSSRRPAIGSRIVVSTSCSARILADRGRGKWLVRLTVTAAGLDALLNEAGHIPLPPYIKRPTGPTAEDVQRYQTVYADRPGAVAAPTAGLHFTADLLAALRERGVLQTTITLHVGYGTFAPVQSEDIRQHDIHREFIDISEETAQRVAATKKAGGTVWAVGTTTVRALEYAAQSSGSVESVCGWCDLYITPGFSFQVVDHLITNFHLPRSSLLFLVAALCGRDRLLACYREAIGLGYRFYSYGDAMAIID
ncbi:MAG: tRNA preQ1(34) S-adenosylmethionine ribosyltransferase-isomerase QueA [Desulfofustis sp.]|nr:tRNA preQ1(34) S-adenosylmethionine ribosyltransferase-isomerase QueA [Desulfofustis sp.]